MKIVWTPLALQRVEEIGEFIAAGNLEAAIAWTEAVFDEVKRLGTYPNSGRIVPELSISTFRELIFGDYRIVYRLSPKTVSILTVRHSRQILSAKHLEM